MNYPIPINLAVNNLNTTVMRFAAELNKLSEIVTKLTKTTETLEHSLSHLCLSVLGDSSNVVRATRYMTQNITDGSESSGKIVTGDLTKQYGVLEVANDIGRLGETTKNALEVINDLPKGLSKLPAIAAMPASIGIGAEGIAEMETKENTNTAEKISIASKILTGAAGAVAAGLEFGLPGLVIYFALEAFTTYTAIAEANKQKQSLAEEAQKKQYERAMKTFVMDENSADEYLNHINKIQARKPQPLHRWKMKANAAGEVVKMYGRNAYDLTIPVPRQVADQLNPRMYMPATIKYDSRQDELARTPSYFEQTFGLQRSLIATGMTEGNQAFVQSSIQAREKARQYDLVHHTNTLAHTELAIKESAYDLLNQANGKHMNQANTAMRSNARPSAGGGEKTIVVNLNRAMIEHFVVNTTDVKEGVNRLKEQVEEALLQILTNAAQ